MILYDQDDNAYGFVVNKTENASGVSVNETNTFYYHKDNMNTIMRIMNEDGTNAALFNYEIYGNICSAEYHLGKEYLKYVNPFLFHDYIYDDDTQLYYLQSRYYAPQLGRFISADSLYDNGSGTITATNMYAYCDNDPINYVDIDGQRKLLTKKYIKTVKNHFTVDLTALMKVRKGATLTWTVNKSVSAQLSGSLGITAKMVAITLGLTASVTLQAGSSYSYKLDPSKGKWAKIVGYLNAEKYKITYVVMYLDNLGKLHVTNNTKDLFIPIKNSFRVVLKYSN